MTFLCKSNSERNNNTITIEYEIILDIRNHTDSCLRHLLCGQYRQRPVKVDVKGEMSLSLYDGKPDISCRVEELSQYVPDAGNDNR